MKTNSIKNIADLSTLCDLPYTTLHDLYIRKNVDTARLSTLKKLASYMNCTMDYLAYDELVNPNWTKKDLQNENSFLNQYNLLFDKDNALTGEQKKFMLEYIKDQHDKTINKENENLAWTRSRKTK